MSRSKTLTAFLMTLMFSQMASAVIVEETFKSQSPEVTLEKNNSVASDRDELISRTGLLTLESQLPRLNAKDFVQDFNVFAKADISDNIVNYTGLENSGIANRADYHGWMVAELSVAAVDQEEVARVPEPSSLSLLLGPLLLLLWRMDVLPKFFRK